MIMRVTRKLAFGSVVIMVWLVPFSLSYLHDFGDATDLVVRGVLHVDGGTVGALSQEPVPKLSELMAEI